ncbi:MAG: NAD(P)/FAD-dependent oxidoreductase [Bacteroidetes bacterium]|nr:NAD(P)/FAD-dependent oxidoreductase [Bacteroidota bacterium]MCL5738045.1 NAD(P)/FAD-dependent oxidoreductase [Bacteroidota bacterium]
MQSKNVVILGGGVGGIVTANHLAKLLPPEIEIILIERNKLYSFPASYLWLMVNKRKPEQVTAQLQDLVDKRITVLYEEAKEIDAENKIIVAGDTKVNFDYLVIALGADLDKMHLNKEQFGIHTFFNLEGAEKLSKGLQSFVPKPPPREGGNVCIVVSSLPYKCPGAPYEGAMLIADYLGSRKLKNHVMVNLYTPEPQPLPVAGPQLGNAIKEMLTAKEIGFHPLHQLSSIDYDKRKIEFASGDSVTYDLLVLVPSHKAPEAILKSSLVDESGWIPVDKDTLETKTPNIFAVGDVNSITIPGKWSLDKPMKLPKAGVFAHGEAITVSEIIASRVSGYHLRGFYCADGFCMLEAGEGVAGFAYGDFYASPHPDVKLKRLGKTWHLGKVLFEKWWLAPVGFRKRILRSSLKFGSAILKIPVRL